MSDTCNVVNSQAVAPSPPQHWPAPWCQPRPLRGRRAAPGFLRVWRRVGSSCIPAEAACGPRPRWRAKAGRGAAGVRRMGWGSPAARGFLAITTKEGPRTQRVKAPNGP